MARNSFRKLRIAMVACFCIVATMDASETASNNFNTDITMDENQNLTQVWDKVFPQSNKVNHSKVSFRNRYGITLTADLYVPKMQSAN